MHRVKKKKRPQTLNIKEQAMLQIWPAVMGDRNKAARVSQEAGTPKGSAMWVSSLGIIAQLQADWVNQGILSWIGLRAGIPPGTWQNQVEILSEGRFLQTRPQIIQWWACKYNQAPKETISQLQEPSTTTCNRSSPSYMSSDHGICKQLLYLKK